MLKSIIAIAALGVAGTAQAAVLFEDNFDGYPTKLTTTNMSPNWTVTGNVDVVNTGTFSIDCVGGAGKCVDLDGTTGPGRLDTRAINYVAGDALTLSFSLSGNQRDDQFDLFNWTFVLAAPTDIKNFTCSASFIGCPPPGNYTSVVSPGTYFESIGGGRPWIDYWMTFTPTTAGSITMTFSTTSGDNIGPVLDNVLVTQSSGVIPEPATWAMLIAGFGLVGTAMRRRRTAVAA